MDARYMIVKHDIRERDAMSKYKAQGVRSRKQPKVHV